MLLKKISTLLPTHHLNLISASELRYQIRCMGSSQAFIEKQNKQNKTNRDFPMRESKQAKKKKKDTKNISAPKLIIFLFYFSSNKIISLLFWSLKNKLKARLLD